MRLLGIIRFDQEWKKICGNDSMEWVNEKS